MALTCCVPLGAWTDARTVPDGMGASVALGPAVARIYRNTSQNRQLRLRNSVHTCAKREKIVGWGSVKFNSR